MLPRHAGEDRRAGAPLHKKLCYRSDSTTTSETTMTRRGATLLTLALFLATTPSFAARHPHHGSTPAVAKPAHAVHHHARTFRATRHHAPARRHVRRHAATKHAAHHLRHKRVV